MTPNSVDFSDLCLACVMQVEHQEDLTVAGQQIEDQRADHLSRLQRVKALSVHLSHNKMIAQSQHKCCTCDRPLNPATELQTFIRKQVWQ